MFLFCVDIKLIFKCLTVRFKVDILDENDKTMKFLKDANQKPREFYVLF